MDFFFFWLRTHNMTIISLKKARLYYNEWTARFFWMDGIPTCVMNMVARDCTLNYG